MMVVIDARFRGEDTNTTAKIIKSELIESELLPSEGLSTSARRLKNTNRNTPVPVMHDGGARRQRCQM
jgi:hypothetical protein